MVDILFKDMLDDHENLKDPEVEISDEDENGEKVEKEDEVKSDEGSHVEEG